MAPSVRLDTHRWTRAIQTLYMYIAGGGLQPVCLTAHSRQLVGAEVPFRLWSLDSCETITVTITVKDTFLGELNGIEIGLSTFFKLCNKV